MIGKDLNFCDQILQAVAILDKSLKILNFYFSQNIFHFNTPLDRDFPVIQICYIFFEYLKSYSC